MPDSHADNLSRIHHSRQTGTASGINIQPGSDDDGWIVPPPVRLADGSAVQLFKDGETLHSAYEAIRRAQRRVWVEIYIFASDGTGRAFAELLSRRARDGLDVRVIYDAVGTTGTDPEMWAAMERAGVRLAEFHPWAPWRLMHGWHVFHRDHRKLFIVDDQLGGLGGLNIADEYGGSWILQKPYQNAWRDTAIELHGPAVRLLAEAFTRMWGYIQHGGPIHRAEFIHTPESCKQDSSDDRLDVDDSARSGGHLSHCPPGRPPLRIARDSVGVLGTVPRPWRRVRPPTRQLFRNARSSIELTMGYFAPSLEFVEQLCRAARAGVRVRLMLPNISDLPLLRLAARGYYAQLLAAGAEIYERRHTVLHAKTFCIDGNISMVGSANLDYRSVRYNCELDLVIHSEAFGRQMHDLFEHDVRFAERVDADAWRRRPAWARLGQRAAKAMRFLL